MLALSGSLDLLHKGMVIRRGSILNSNLYRDNWWGATQLIRRIEVALVSRQCCSVVFNDADYG